VVEELELMENNHFKTMLHDPEIIEKWKDKPFHMAFLYAFSEYAESGRKVEDLPWFCCSRKDGKIPEPQQPNTWIFVPA
jgi:hypothetical protein